MSIIFLCAFAGGVLRGLVGFLKHQFAYKEVKFKLSYFLGTMFISGTIGLVSALAVKEIGFTLLGDFTGALAFIIGYAGGDFVENIFKIIFKKSDLMKNE